MIPKIVYTVHLAETPVPESFRHWRTEWQQHHPEWDLRVITLDDRDPYMAGFSVTGTGVTVYPGP